MQTHRITIIMRGGVPHAFTRAQLDEARQLAQELGAMSEILADLQGEYLTTAEVVRYAGISRSRIYQLLEVGRFPPAVVLPPLGRKRVAWRSSDIRCWVEQRQQKHDNEARRRSRQILAQADVDPQAGDYLTISEVVERTGYCRASVYSLMDRNMFPRPALRSRRRVYWSASAVAAWLQERARTAA